MEVCNKCGEPMKIKNPFDRQNHLLNNKFYCKKCLEEARKEFFMSE